MRYFIKLTLLVMALGPLGLSVQSEPITFGRRWLVEQPARSGAWQIDPSSVAVDPNGDIIVTMLIQARASDDGSGFDWLTNKYSGADGRLIWSRGFNGPADRRDA